MSHTYCVYILASRSRGLYTGVTNNLERRIIEHRQELIPGFTSRYRIFRLVHFEVFNDVRAAIAREKEIKGWRREKKIRLIESHNSTWADLADHFPAKHKTADPSHHSPKPGERVRDDNRPTGRETQRAAPAPVPNRPQSQFDAAPQPSPTSRKANAGEGPAVPSRSPKPTN